MRYDKNQWSSLLLEHIVYTSGECLCQVLNSCSCIYRALTTSSAIVEGPRDASCQLKSCKLPCNSAETTCTTSPEQIEVMKLEGYSGAMCNKHVHSTMTRSSRFHCPIGVINKLTTDELWISPVHRRIAVAKFSKYQCRNCSRDPYHAHLGNTHTSQD